jgi:hypothetical protein
MKVAYATTLINQSSIIDVGKGSSIDHVVIHNGVEVLECLCADGMW